MQLPLQFPPFVPCPRCGTLLRIDHEYYYDYFRGASRLCPTCNALLDWWSVILDYISDTFPLLNLLAPVGGRSTDFRVVLRPLSTTLVNLGEHDIPADATVLWINYTPIGGGNLFPAELYGNMPPRRIVPHSITLWPVPMGEGPYTDTEVQVTVSWVPHSGDDYAWQNLVEAFEAFSAARFPALVVPANVAVEATLLQILTAALRQAASGDNVRSFLRDGATYGHQLNVVLPALTRLLGLPALPDHIRGALNELRELRNDMAHQGFLRREMGRREAAMCLCAALFGFHYLQAVRPSLIGEVKE